ncbi:hypothetical protein NHJ13734_005165 [Beauveria thailandica]
MIQHVENSAPESPAPPFLAAIIRRRLVALLFCGPPSPASTKRPAPDSSRVSPQPLVEDDVPRRLQAPRATTVRHAVASAIAARKSKSAPLSAIT